MSAAAETEQAYAYVYVIGLDDGPQKVGFSTNPAIRCRSLGGKRYKVHHALEVYASDARAVERYAHCLLYDRHAKGEWFSVAPDEAREIIQDAALAVQRGEEPPFVPLLAKRKQVSGRTNAIKASFEPEEKVMLERAASDSGLTVSTFMRMAALNLARERGYTK